MRTTHVETVIIGAGQAGLATGYHLQRHGRPFVIVDANARIGDNWRQQWDSLRLYSPARYDGLPGLKFPADRWSFPGKEEVAGYLEQYAERFQLPVRLSTRVEGVDPSADDGYVITTSRERITCDNVVIATGTFGRTPSVPAIATELDSHIVQLHSSQYRRPGQLQEGSVLVVGASHSGTDIAYEVAEARPTILAGRDCGQIPVHVDARRMRLLFPLLMFVWRHLLTRRTPVGRKAMPKVRFHGGPMLRVHRSDLRARSAERSTGRVERVVDGKPVVDGEPRDVANVIWATGFHQTLADWIHLPVFDEDGWPREARGIVQESPGVFFCGLSFQYAFASMLLPGVGRDAEFVVRRILDRPRRRTTPQNRVPAA